MFVWLMGWLVDFFSIQLNKLNRTELQKNYSGIHMWDGLEGGKLETEGPDGRL